MSAAPAEFCPDAAATERGCVPNDALQHHPPGGRIRCESVTVLTAVLGEAVARKSRILMDGDRRRIGGGTSLVDRVTHALAARHGIERTFAFDASLAGAGLAPVATES